MDENLVEILKDTIAMQKQTNKRLFITIFVLIAVIIITNVAWLVYESQYETITDTSIYEEYDDISQQADTGGNNIVGGNNSVN